MKLTEIRSLVTISIWHDGKGSFTLSYPGGCKIFKGSVKGFAKFLQKIQAKDGASYPKSARNKTYMEIAQDVFNGKDPIIYVWSNILNKLEGMQFTEEVLKEEKLYSYRFTTIDGISYKYFSGYPVDVNELKRTISSTNRNNLLYATNMSTNKLEMIMITNILFDTWLFMGILEESVYDDIYSKIHKELSDKEKSGTKITLDMIEDAIDNSEIDQDGSGKSSDKAYEDLKKDFLKESTLKESFDKKYYNLPLGEYKVRTQGD